jgi:hypothetical protein
MSKTCEVCGRPIKTGRKYCWEHRHTGQSEGRTSWERVEKGYVRHKLGWFWLSIYRYFYYLGIFFVVASLLFNYLLIVAGALIFLRLIASFKIDRIKREITNRSPDYIKWTEICAGILEEEREFKKSLSR